MEKIKFENVPHYINSFEGVKLEKLNEMREIIKNAAPDATEKISYNMPSYHLNGVLVYFGMAKNHLGFYPTGRGVEPFLDRLTDYKTSKGCIQFKLTEPLPVELITDIVEFRVNENMNK